MKLTIEQVQKDLDALPEHYKTGDVDRLIRRYVRQKADVSALRPYILDRQQFHRIYYYVTLDQIRSAEERMAFIHENLLFSDWWHTDQLISYVAEVDFDSALRYAAEYIQAEDPFIRRWGYVLFISPGCARGTPHSFCLLCTMMKPTMSRWRRAGSLRSLPSTSRKWCMRGFR